MSSDHTIPTEILMRCQYEEITMLQAWREHVGISRAEMAEHMGITQKDYIELEKMPELTEADRSFIASLMGLDPQQLIAKKAS